MSNSSCSISSSGCCLRAHREKWCPVRILTHCSLQQTVASTYDGQLHWEIITTFYSRPMLLLLVSSSILVVIVVRVVVAAVCSECTCTFGDGCLML